MILGVYCLVEVVNLQAVSIDGFVHWGGGGQSLSQDLVLFHPPPPQHVVI